MSDAAVIRALDREIQRQEVALQDLKDELQADTPQEQALEQLEAALKDAQEEQQMNENTYGDAVVEKDRLNAEQRPVKDKLNEIQQKLEEIGERIEEAKKKLHQAEDKRAAELLQTNKGHEAVKDAEKAKERLEKDRDHQLGMVDSFTEQAEQVSPRIPIDEGETIDTLDAKLRRLQREQAIQQRE